MGMMSRVRLALASLVPLSLLMASCAEAPPPTSPPQGPSMQGGAYQPRGYANQGSVDQAGAAPSATAGGQPAPWGIPGLVEVAPRTVPDAVAQLDRAEQLLGFVLAPKAGESHSPPAPPLPGASVGAATEAPVPLGDPCLIACAALASMKRSAEHVCSMAGEGDGMCGAARSRVQRAEQRVTASCPACSVGK